MTIFPAPLRKMPGTLIMILILGAATAPLVSVVHATDAVVISSPGGSVQATVSLDGAGQLQYSVTRGGVTTVETTPLGIIIDGVALGAGVTLGTPGSATVEETYPLSGVHPSAISRSTLTTIPVVHSASGMSYSLEVRAFDNGLAYRYIVPGSGTRTVVSEQSSWKIPDGTTVWFFENSSDAKLKSYSGAWTPTDVNQLPTISPQGPVQGAGLTLELPNGGGYAVLTEAALANYSGMRLEAIGNRTVRANFSEGEAGFKVNGTVITPWRVTVATADLNGLVNSDIITNLSPAPDQTLYGDTSWIKAGRSVWRWASSGTGTLEQERVYVDYAAQMGFEYTTVDNGWETSFVENGLTAWDNLKALCDYAREHAVGVVVWKNANALVNSAKDWQDLRLFLDNVQRAGGAGVKLDYIDTEAKNRIDFELTVLRKAAERKLIVNFHGISKPTGEQRTYPNQLTREAVRGLESGLPGARHDAALPFTRLALGPADYTPLAYTNNYGEQLAMQVLVTSPLQTISASAEKMLDDPATAPALDVVKAVPAVWDETRVLAPSQIGKLALLARRSGERWFLAAVNGDKNNPAPLSHIDLSFLGAKTYHETLLSSGAADTVIDRQEAAGVGASSDLSLSLAKAGGFVALFTPEPVATQLATSVTLSASATLEAQGTPVSLVATVSASQGTPSGTVRFVDGATLIGSATLDGSGRAVLSIATLSPGVHHISANYAGNSGFAPSSSSPFDLEISATLGGKRVLLPVVTHP